jgi:hypothetical protein
MTRKQFATLIFQGDRFRAAMPVEVLPELAAYQELVVSVAKGMYARRNPQRKRLPNGFVDSFRLTLERVEEGSAIPVVLRETTPATYALVAKLGLDYFEEARQVVESSIRAAVSDLETLPVDMSPEVLAKFNAFGKTLKDDDAIVVAPPESREGARYTKAIRRKLVLRVQESIEEPVTIVGSVISVGREPTYLFEIRQLASYVKVEIRSSKPFFEQAVRALTEETLVSVSGTGLFDRRGELTKMTDVSDMSLAEEFVARPGCALPIDQQVASFEHLAPGWYNPKSPGFDPVDLKWTARLFKAVVQAFDLPNPYVYPTPDGGVRAEWTADQWEVAVTIDAKNRRTEVFATEVSTGEVHENAFMLDEAGSESMMGRFLAQHFHGRHAA